ncbi:hypothetical protein GA0111570_103212 [Raineyella antarctica]|uniref:Secreted protein n=1 Tax=Raineyella antarctica TaxID=1577474 RepID=A0A1G6GH08_9ACTN|nr:hypothetical protein [Raineyella antarctica]SDB81103.1 hypothetical protein GA0111570_103212 [Raineyella antarctica]
MQHVLQRRRGAVRVAATALAVCGVVAGCAGRPDAAAVGPAIGDIDYRNFTYRGGCGWEKPALDTLMSWGRQPAVADPADGTASKAQVVATRTVRLGTPARRYLLVRLQCSIGDATATGWHLLGYDGDRPLDLGIVAAAYGPVDVTEVDGELLVEHAYRSTADGGLSDSGRTSYRVAVAGLTPVRLYGGEQAADIPAGVAHWPGGTWQAGLLTLAASGPDSTTDLHLGVQLDPLTAVTADTLTGGDLGCRPMLARTRTGQRIEPLTTQGWNGQGGAVVHLSLPSDAPDTSRVRHLTEPLGGPLHGLLVTGSGIVPALATASTAGTGVRVGSQAPTDDALEDSSFTGPTALFRDDTGAAVASGPWSADAGAGAPMQPLPDPTLPPGSTCGPA